MNIELSTPIIVASYLFDHNENQDAIAGQFQNMMKSFQPERVVLITSAQINKRNFLDHVARTIAGTQYENYTISNLNIFKGGMTKVMEVRNKLNKEHGTKFSRYIPKWDERSFYSRVILKKERMLFLTNIYASVLNLDQINLYVPPIHVRSDILLNTQQLKAAELNARPTVITGPAGCGKSVVITERIKNLCQSLNYNKSLSVLLTTFNKGLMSFLGNWLENILDGERIKRIGNDFQFEGSNIINVRLMHFDILPTRIGKIRGNLSFDSNHKHYLNEAANAICLAEGITRSEYKEILNPDFLYDEYVRVIYGQQYESLSVYQTGRRKGRPFQLNHNSIKRELIWKVISHYLKYLTDNNKESVFTRRHKFLRDLKRGFNRKIYSHIFVDEFQDCTQADYQIFYGLLKDNNNLVVAGDFAQAVHLGRSASVPREDELFQGVTRMRNWETKKLEGSYRLPFRISECIKPLSEHLRIGHEDSDIITPWKGAPPGARLIVVHANDTKIMMNKIAWILWYYRELKAVDISPPFRNKINILEKDRNLSLALNNWKTGIAETDTILRLKGMEKKCIVWSTRASIDDDEDIFNYIYTILTRTTSLLIIALFPNLNSNISKTLSMLDREKVILWDEETTNVFTQIMAAEMNSVST